MNCMAWHSDKENNVVYTNVTWTLAFRPKQTFLFIVAVGVTWFPYFKAKEENKLQEITQEEVAMPFLHLFAKGAQVLEAGLPLHLEDRHFAKFVSLNDRSLEHCGTYNQGLFWGTI